MTLYFRRLIEYVHPYFSLHKTYYQRETKQKLLYHRMHRNTNFAVYSQRFTIDPREMKDSICLLLLLLICF